MLLARKGYRVLLVDKATFPSDTVSTHNLTLAAMDSLQRWGLYDTIAATDCPPVNRLRFDLNGLVIDGWSGPLNGIERMYNVRRNVLDEILLEAAVAAGAYARQGFTVDEVIVEDGVCGGIRGHARSGELVEARAPIVVGADGKHSRVAAAMNAAEYMQVPASTFTYYSYYSDLDLRGQMELMDRGETTIVAQPTSGDRVLIAVMGPAAKFKEFRSDVEGNFERALATVPEFHERVKAATREERFIGAVDVPNAVRVPYGPGFALVGDAGLHVDPMLGQGITNAFRDADLLAEAIDRGLRGEAPMQVALKDFHEARDAAALPMYELICSIVTGEASPPEVDAAMAALPGNQLHIDRFIGVMLGTVRVEDFYSPESLAAIVADAQVLQAAA